jgi:predicted GIY-YIG superfamily endonuclease
MRLDSTRLNAKTLIAQLLESGGHEGKLPPAAGIYAIVNRTNGRAYIGSSVNIRNRIVQHRSALRRGRHPNKLLRAEWQDHGEAAFVFGVLHLPRKTDKRYLWSIEHELTRQLLGPRCYSWGVFGQSGHFAYHPAMRGVAEYFRPN